MDKLKKADSYIEKNKVSSKELPEFHVAPQIGWINDPNGFSYYNGFWSKISWRSSPYCFL